MRGLKNIVAAVIGVSFVAQPTAAKIWTPGARKVAEPVASLLADLRKTKSNVFFSDCAIGDDIKAVLIFKAGQTEADFFILSYKPGSPVLVPSRGKVGFKQSGLHDLGVAGTSEKILPHLGTSLMVSKITFLPGDDGRFNDIVTNRPEAMCSGEPNTKP